MTKTISFSFNVFNDNEIIAQKTMNYTVSEKRAPRSRCRNG